MVIDGIRYEVTRIHRLFAIAQRVSFDGDARANRLEAQACSIRLRGGAGHDLLKAHRRGTNSYEGCRDYTMKLLGQRGDDTLRGSAEDDVLIGGPGRDTASGEAGRDTCAAEVEAECEQ